MIIFHANLFHYGDIATLQGNIIDPSLRLFTFLHKTGNWQDNEPNTFHAEPENNWCLYQCADCTEVHEHLKNEYCNNNDDMLWKKPHTDTFIQRLNA